MSIEVLKLSDDQRYKHNFIDDLQSFFWVILWSVALHLNPGVETSTQHTSDTLDALDQSSLTRLASSKVDLLIECHIDHGFKMDQKLASFKNDWASDESIIAVILGLGDLFAQLQLKMIRALTPAVIFPRVVDIILDALACDDGIEDEGVEAVKDPAGRKMVEE